MWFNRDRFTSLAIRNHESVFNGFEILLYLLGPLRRKYVMAYGRVNGRQKLVVWDSVKCPIVLNFVWKLVQVSSVDGPFEHAPNKFLRSNAVAVCCKQKNFHELFYSQPPKEIDSPLIMLDVWYVR